MPDDRRDQLRWDNMIEWRGEVTSTINHLEKACEKYEAILQRIEEMCRDWPRACEQSKSELREQVSSALSEMREGLRAEFQMAISNLNNVENQVIQLEGIYKALDEKYATKDSVNKVDKKVGNIPLKVAAALTAILAVYEALQAAGWL